MTHQQRQHLVDACHEMKNPQKSPILTTNGQLVNHVVRVMIVATVEIVRLVANNLLTNQQNQLCMSVPMVSR
jgi:hypothetical protein